MEKFFGYSEKLLKLSGLIALFFLAAGYINLYSYYRYFNIDIGNYINASEIIVSSFATVFIALLSLLAFQVLMTIMTVEIKIITLMNKLATALITIILLVLLDIFFHYLFSPVAYFVFFIKFGLLVVIFTISSVIYSVSKIFFYKSKLTIRAELVLFIPITLCLIIANNYINSMVIKDKFFIQRNTTELYFNDSSKILKGDSVQSYVGKTDNFYFVWNKKTKETTIYPATEIKKIIR